MIWIALVLGSLGAGWLLGTGDAGRNLRSAGAGLPEHLLTALLGFTGGLYARERIRLHRTHASPTLAYVGKLILFGAAAASAAAVFTPVSWPSSALSLFAVAGAAGLFIWLGNLPSRL